MVSSVGSPNVFSTFDGATAWHANDTITGLIPAQDNSLVVLGANSVARLHGSAASGGDAFQLVQHSKSGGAIPYSAVAAAGDIYYMTPNGIVSLAATDKYGDFALASVSGDVRPWLEDRVNVQGSFREPLGKGLLKAIPVRRKNQIRYYFKDGWVLIMHLGGEQPKFTTQHYGFNWPVDYTDNAAVDHGYYYADKDYVPIAVANATRADGSEFIYASFLDGSVNALDHKWDDVYFCVQTNPLLGSNPLEDVLKINQFSLGVERPYNLDCALWLTQSFDERWPLQADYSANDGITKAWYTNVSQSAATDGFNTVDVGTHLCGQAAQGAGFAFGGYTPVPAKSPLKFLGITYSASLLSGGLARMLRPQDLGATHDNA